MKAAEFGTSLTVFFLFFGLALVEAVQKHNWIEASLFLLLGIVSLRADIKQKQARRRR